MLIREGKTPAQCWNSVIASQTHLSVNWNLSEAGNAPSIPGASPTEQCENGGFSTSGKGRSWFVLLWGNAPSEAGTPLFFGQKHLHGEICALSPTEGTPKLEMRNPAPPAAPGSGWDGVGRTGSPCPQRAPSLCHLVALREGLAQADHERRGMRRNGFANETWRR